MTKNMRSSLAKNSARLVLSGLLCVLICDIGGVIGAVFRSPNSDDAIFWRQQAESYLKRILQYESNRKGGAGVARNVIIFVGDGMGIASLSTGRIFKGQLAGRSGEEEVLSFDHFHNTGFSKTYNTDRQVPDSAGTATAMFTGVKTKSGFIGVDYSATETNEVAASVSNIMEWAQAVGKRTGIVTTTTVTHATPAATYAHSFSRYWECEAEIPAHLRSKTKDIARQLVEDAPGNKLNVIMGGGRTAFGAANPDHLKSSFRFNGSIENTCMRQDGHNLVNEWLDSKNGSAVTYAWNTAQLMNAEVDDLDYLMGLFADTHMSYELVRDTSEGGEPSLADMTEKAIRVLKRKNSNGFVLMVEGGRIDHGHHENHAHLALREVVELDRAVERTLGMVDLDDTLIMVTADHSHSMTFNGYPDRGNDVLDAIFWRQQAESYLKRILQYEPNRKGGAGVARNVIIFVGDGMGIASLSTGRIFKGQLAGRSGEEEVLSFDHFQNTGFSKTYNTDRQVPDSAGTATAMFTGVKTKYGFIGVDYSATETNEVAASVSNIMEWAQAADKRTGIVTTTRVTHATPAATYAHSFSRDWECEVKIPAHLRSKTKDIARQLVEDAPGSKLNVIMGGGRTAFGAGIPDHLKASFQFNGSMEKTCVRQDGRNLVNEWLDSKNGSAATYAWNTAQLMNAEVDDLDYLMGLFADTHMSYEQVRDTSEGGEPSLADMTEKAIRVLKRKNSNGFVLMVEGGRIDHAHHQNHAHLALREVVELDRAVERALGMVDLDDTLIMVTADHSHSMTFNGYPDRGNDILGYANRPDKLPYETITYANGPGFQTHRINDSSNEPSHLGTWIPVETMNRSAIDYRHLSAFYLGDETHGGEDVAVFATGPGSNLVRGTFEQNYIAYVLSYAGCMGPAKRLNEGCAYKQRGSSGAESVQRSSFQLLISIVFLAVAKLCYHF